MSSPALFALFEISFLPRNREHLDQFIKCMRAGNEEAAAPHLQEILKDPIAQKKFKELEALIGYPVKEKRAKFYSSLRKEFWAHIELYPTSIPERLSICQIRGKKDS